MKKIFTLFLLTLFSATAFAQDECEASAGVLVLPFSCLPNNGPGSLIEGIDGFTEAPSGTSTYEFVLTSPPTDLGAEVVLGVNETGTFDLNSHPDTGEPMSPGTYGITVFAYDSEDLVELTSTVTIQDLLEGCISADGTSSLEEVLNCVSSSGLVMGELTIDLVRMNVIETLAPILLMREMCHEFGETQYFEVKSNADECIVGVDDIIFSSLKILYDPSIQNARIDFPYFNEVSEILVYNENGKTMPFASDAMEFDFSNFPKGMYFVNVRTEQFSQTNKLLVY